MFFCCDFHRHLREKNFGAPVTQMIFIHKIIQIFVNTTYQSIRLIKLRLPIDFLGEITPNKA